VSAIPGLGLIAFFSRLVPLESRGDWRREWEAEAAFAWRERQASGRGGRAGLRGRAFWCVTDALMLRVDSLLERKKSMRATGALKDLRIALRSLGRSPAFAGISVLTLALGIGANTAVFTLVDGVVLRPLPYRESDRLVSVQHLGRDGADELPTSTGLYLLYRERSRTLASIGLHQQLAVNLAGEGEPERVDGQGVTPGLFDVLGVSPAIGQGFTEEQGRPGGEPVVVLSDALWRTRFGANPSVVGTTVVMDGVSRRVVGVMPRGFAYPDERARLYIPMIIIPEQAPIANFTAQGVGRLAEGATPVSVQAELQSFIGRLSEFYPESGAVAFLAEVGLKAKVVSLKESVVGDLSRTLWILLGTVGFVLLIACANVANLFLVRAEGRQRELAVRRALGGGRWAVLRPFLAESLILGVTGGLAGLAVANAALRATSALAAANLPRMNEIGMDVRVLAFTGGIALLSAILFGVLPMLPYRRTALSGQLKEGGARGATGARERHRIRNGLVVTQVALALVLLVGSGLMLRSFMALRTVDPGFDAGNVLTVRLAVPQGEMAQPVQVAGFYRELLDALAAQPGVLYAGAGSGAPLTSIGIGFGGTEVEDHPRAQDELPVMASSVRVAAGYVEALGIRILEGRSLQPSDGATGFRGVLVSQSFARHWWPDGSALGRRVRNGSGEEWYEIVGVTEDVHYGDLQQAAEEMIYFPAMFGPVNQPFFARAMDVVVRVSGDPLAFLPALRREVWSINPRIPLANPRTMETVLTASMGRTSFTMVMLGSASAVALVLGMVGIYGVISYVVTQRTREIGVRLALGASGATVRAMVVRQGFALAAAGVGLGLLAAVALSSVMGSILFGVRTTDPLTYASVALVLTFVSVLASWIPAHRAASVHPAVALRNE
jgi:predicted permease